MRTLLSTTLLLLLGIWIGWYAGYTRPQTIINRDFIKKSGMSNEQIQQCMENAKIINQTLAVEERAALISLNALLQLAAGKEDKAKAILRRPIISVYYELGSCRDLTKKRTPDQERLAHAIERFASMNSEFKQSLTAHRDETNAPNQKMQSILVPYATNLNSQIN